MSRLGWGAFCILCLASASAWLLPISSLAPGVSGLVTWSPAIALMLVALIGLVVARVRSPRLPSTVQRRAGEPSQTLAVVVSGVGAIAVPMLLVRAGQPLCGAAWSVAAFSSAPLWIALSRSVLHDEPLQQHLIGCIAALAGALLLLPVSEPTSPRAAFGLLLCFAAAGSFGLSAVVCHRIARQMAAARAFSGVALANAVVLCAANLVFTHPRAEPAAAFVQLWPAVIFQSGVAALTVWLLRAAAPRVLGTQYLWAPVLTAIEGWVLLRPELSWRIGAGGVLLALSAAWLLRADTRVSDEVLSLR